MQRKIRNRKRQSLEARKQRSAGKVARSERHRLTVYRSSKHIYALLVDPVSGSTVASVSSRSQGIEASGEGGKIGVASAVGKAIADVAKEKNIQEVVFNKNGFLYHGRVKALAEAARENGLNF